MNSQGVASPTRIWKPVLFTFLAAALMYNAPADDRSPGERREISLNGTWESMLTADPAYPPRGAQWRAVEIPALTEGNALQGSRYTWCRREVEVPESFRGRRIDLVLHGARFNAAVFCNGIEIGSRLEGYTPWAVDLTARVQPGRTFKLEIRCQDWSAVFKDGFRLPSDADANGEKLRGVPQGRLLAPIGGHFNHFGIWDDVTLTARPPVHCADVAITTSVRQGDTLFVTGEAVGGKAGLWVEGAVLDEGTTVLAIPGRVIGADLRFALSAKFPKPRYWSPEDPHRYVLSLILKDKPQGAALDRYEERFGFRELWAEGPDFYLNRVKRHLLATSGWPSRKYQSPEEIRRAIADLRASKAVAFRLHTQPWQRRWLEEADAAGLLIIEEGALWCDGGGGYAYGDGRFWANVDEHLAGMVRRDRNHPALVMWSIENEILHCGAERYCACAAPELAAAGRKVKALDPAHLITYEADHDPAGAADVIGLHYPLEMPDHTDYPNAADWLETAVTTGTGGGLSGSWNRDFLWDRKKPLYIGEYLWVFQQDFSPGSVFFGDEAYRDKEYYRVKAKALAWEIQTVAYRRAGVSGMCPWTIAAEGGRVDPADPLLEAQRKAYEPVAVYPREHDTRFFSGEKITRRFDVFNDSPRPLALEVRFTLEGWAKGYTERFTLEPAGSRLVTVTVPLPARSAPSGLTAGVILSAEGKKVHSFETRYRVFEKKPLTVPAGQTLLVFDPKGLWPAGRDVSAARALKSLDELSRFDPKKSILVIGPSAFADHNTAAGKPVIGLRQTTTVVFRRFLNQGGRALVLEQETYAPLMGDRKLVPHSSTMTFAAWPGHPLLAGLGPEDLKFWRGDHRVTRKEFLRTQAGSTRAVLVSGGIDVVGQSPILELSLGRGRAVLCQALAGSKYDTEPAARLLVANAVRRLAAAPLESAPALLAANGTDGPEFARRLDEIGLDYSVLPDRPAQADLDRARLLILHGGGQAIEALAPLLTGRKPELTVYWHAPEAAAFDKLKSVLGWGKAAVIPASGPLLIPEKSDPLLDGVLREDLAFLRPFGPDNWYREIDYDQTVIDRAVDFPSPDGVDAYQVETWNLSGGYVQAVDNAAVAFYTDGTAAGEITVGREGLHRISVRARGTSAAGAWPIVLVKANGRIVGQTSVTGREMGSFPLLAELPRGRVKLELAFANDLFKGGEDRNLFIDSIEVGRSPLETDGLSLYSLPPAIVLSAPGRRTVVDCVRWDTNADNRVRGLRYAAALLGNLGASFRSPNADAEWIEAPSFEPEGKTQVFSRTETQLNFAAAGAVRATFTCAAGGSYTVLIRGFSSPAQGVFGKARVRVDGKVVGESELDSASAREFSVGTVRLEAGEHEVSVEFSNDLWLGPGKEDRNLYVNAVGFLTK